MPDLEPDEDLRFDPLVILGSFLTLSAYAICFAVNRISINGIDLNIVGAVFCGSLSAILNMWVFLRKGKHHKDSSKLAAFNFWLCLPFSCCGWGALSH
ncbi:hypothetical protein SAMN05444166_3816 [Singulisphaera sp. GP187]|nr:hypothetical protein SAMN05444166_3816 [Singulisphaera sp. GP187]